MVTKDRGSDGETTMNIAEYIEQNMDKNSCRITVFYHKLKKDFGLKDVRTAKELVSSDLQELFKCRYITRGAFGVIISNVITELFFSENAVTIDFSHWINALSHDNPYWLSDILQQTRMNNYIVRGE